VRFFLFRLSTCFTYSCDLAATSTDLTLLLTLLLFWVVFNVCTICCYLLSVLLLFLVNLFDDDDLPPFPVEPTLSRSISPLVDLFLSLSIATFVSFTFFSSIAFFYVYGYAALFAMVAVVCIFSSVFGLTLLSTDPWVTWEFGIFEALVSVLVILPDSYNFLIFEVISLSCSVYFLSAAVCALIAAIFA